MLPINLGLKVSAGGERNQFGVVVSTHAVNMGVHSNTFYRTVYIISKAQAVSS
jgi:hypothetical protein